MIAALQDGMMVMSCPEAAVSHTDMTEVMMTLIDNGALSRNPHSHLALAQGATITITFWAAAFPFCNRLGKESSLNCSSVDLTPLKGSRNGPSGVDRFPLNGRKGYGVMETINSDIGHMIALTS